MLNYENSMKSLKSLKKVDDYGMFQMTFYGDYGFDEFLKVGANNHEEYIQRVEEIVYRDIPDMELKLNEVGAGCTTFCSRNEDGDVVFGRNYDFPVYCPALQVITRPDNGYASVSTVSMIYMEYGEGNLPNPDKLDENSLALLAAPYIPADGVNEKGVAIAVLTVSEAEPPYDENKRTLVTTAAIRLVLDKAANVDEAIKLLGQYNIFFSLGIISHFHITDASGRAVVVEYYDGEMKVTETQVASNFIAWNNVQKPQGNAVERHDTIKEVLDNNSGVLTKKQVIDVLGKVGWAERGLQWTAIYNLSTLAGTIFVAGNTSNMIDFTL